jgi:hypothetical protein
MAAQQALLNKEVEYPLLGRIWEALSPDPMLGAYEKEYRWLTQVHESVKPPSGNGELRWHALGAKTVELINENVHVESVRDDVETLVIPSTRSRICRPSVYHLMLTSSVGSSFPIRVLYSSFFSVAEKTSFASRAWVNVVGCGPVGTSLGLSSSTAPEAVAFTMRPRMRLSLIFQIVRLTCLTGSAGVS